MTTTDLIETFWVLGPDDDPYAVFDDLRAAGPVVPAGPDFVTANHRVCNAILRDRRFGVRPLGDPGLRQRTRRATRSTSVSSSANRPITPGCVASRHRRSDRG